MAINIEQPTFYLGHPGGPVVLIANRSGIATLAFFFFHFMDAGGGAGFAIRGGFYASHCPFHYGSVLGHLAALTGRILAPQSKAGSCDGRAALFGVWLVGCLGTADSVDERGPPCHPVALAWASGKGFWLDVSLPPDEQSSR